MKKSNQLPTVTIGIPAFNEEKNIGFLLDQLFSQKSQDYILDQIIISSDNSSDQTVNIAKGCKSPLIRILENKKRIGNAGRQNQLMNLANSEILVLLNADIFIGDKEFISKLIKPIAEGRADLTSPGIKAFRPKKIIEKSLAAGFLIKDYIYQSINKGDNIYFCHGAARGFSKRFYKTIKFRESVGEDAYAYLLCKFKKLSFKLVNTSCYIKLPETISDHQKQSIRFIQSQTKFYKEFGKEFVKNQYGSSTLFFGINFLLVFKGIYFGLTKNPFYTTTYLLLSTWIQFKRLFYSEIESTWEISQTSKNLYL